MELPIPKRIAEIEVLKHLAQHAPLWQEWLTPKGECIYISPYCEEISGYRADEFHTDAALIRKITHSEDQEKLGKFFSASARLIDQNLSLRIKHRKGEIRWIQGSSHPIYNPDGSLTGTYRCFQDISQLKHLEEKTIETQKMIQAIMHAPNDISFIINTRGEITHSGKLISMRTDIPQDELIGKSLWDLFTPKVANYRKGWIDEVLASKKPIRVEDNQTLGDGPLSFYDTWIYPILDTEGEVTHIAIMARDISPLKITEQELQQSKRQLEVILEGVANGIYVLDQSGSLIYTNRTNTNQLIDSFIGLNSTPETVFEKYNIINEDEKAPCSKKLPGRSALRGEYAPPVILRYKMDDNAEEHWLIIKATPVFDEHKNVKFAIIITNDITELKKTQLELEKAHRELEDRINVRTAELSQAIQELQQEIATRKKAEQTVRQNAADAEALSHVAARLNAQLGLDAVLNTVCEEAARVAVSMPAVLVSVFLYDQEQDALIKFASHNVTGEFPIFWPEIPRAIYDLWLKTYGPTIIVPNKNNLEQLGDIDLPNNFPFYSYLSISMWHEEELIGCLDLVSLDKVQVLTKHELVLIQAIANQAATAIVNAKLFEEVTIARNRLQQISQKLVQIQEQERRYLARELHDEIGGLLTSLRINLDLAARSQETAQNLPLTQAQELVDQLIKQIREISLDLRPTILDDLGLLPALLSHFEQYSKRTKITVDFKHKGIERRFTPEVETTAFRTIQEALTNIARHANVGKAAVRIWTNDEWLGLQIKDEGKGFDFQKVELLGNTSGLSGIRERVKMCQGYLEIEAVLGQGACLTAELPLNINQEGTENNDFNLIGG